MNCLLNIIDFSKDYKEEIFEMMKDFYSSPALDHPLSSITVSRLLDDILSEDKNVYGKLFKLDKKLVGFGVLIRYYSSEVAGDTVQFEDIYIKDEYRGRGFASNYITRVMKESPDVKRYRLEVAPVNVNAKKLYEKLGFNTLNYTQMVYDRL